MGRRGETIAKKRKRLKKKDNNTLIDLETVFLFVFSFQLFGVFLIVLPLNNEQTSLSV